MKLLFALSFLLSTPAHAAMSANALTKSPCFFENRYKLEMEMINAKIEDVNSGAISADQINLSQEMDKMVQATKLYESSKFECEKKRFIN